MTDIKQLQENAAVALALSMVGMKWRNGDGSLRVIVPPPRALEETRRIVGVVFDAAEIASMVKEFERDLASKRRAITRLERQVDPPDVPGEALEDFAYWQEKLNHPRAKLDGKRRRAIVARIRDGIPRAQRRKAIDGVAAFPYLVNGARAASGHPSQRFDDFELIFRSAPNVDRFARLAPDEGRGDKPFLGR